MEDGEGKVGDDPKLLVEVEWGLMISLLLFIATFYIDFKGIVIALDEDYSLAL